MRISYAIPVCNEIEEIKRLLEFLIQAKRRQDEIVILVDEQNGTEEVKDYVEDFLIVFRIALICDVHIPSFEMILQHIRTS
jgi:hypothetical protein